MANKISWAFALCCVVLLSWGADVRAFRVMDKLDIGGYLQNETAFSTVADGDALWCENRLIVYGTYNYDANVRLFFRLQGYYDALQDVQSDNYEEISGSHYVNDWKTHYRDLYWEPVSYTSSEVLKEFFLDITMPKFDLRIGKQQFAWGVTDGLKVLDIVYPQDFRKFNQEDFEESRIPLWSLKLDYYVGTDSAIQLIYLPRFEPAFAGGAGHPFSVWGNEFADVAEKYGISTFGIPTSFNITEDRPRASMNNSEVGAMWRQNFGPWSYTINYFHHYTDTPAPYDNGAVLYGGLLGLMGIPQVQNLELRYKMVESFGGSFDATLSDLPLIGSIILRLEALYNHNNVHFTGTGEPLLVPIQNLDNGAVIWEAGEPLPEPKREDDWMYAIGVDKMVLTDLFLSLQFIQSHIRKWDSTFVHPLTGKEIRDNERWVSFLIQKDWLNERMWTKCLVVAGQHGDNWIQPQISYLFRDKVKLLAMGNFYGGAPNRMWSRFDDADNVMLRVTYQF
ncbi:MAG: DUF1302 family protein [Thermodesulfobacteriota bacterium]|nr:DUF1302 family protein [Thermodesulfobacteriota bacterium]